MTPTKRQGTRPYWWAIARDTAKNRPAPYRPPVVAPGVAMTWTKMHDGYTGGKQNVFGLEISPDGTTVCFGNYQTSAPRHRLRIWRSHCTDDGATLPAFTKVDTVSSASNHLHDVYGSVQDDGVWYATTSDGPSATDANYFLFSTDDGAT